MRQVNEIFYSHHIENGIAALDLNEIQHISKTYRMSIGDTIHLTDGQGSLLNATINQLNRSRGQATIESTIKRIDQTKLTVAFGITSNPTRNKFLIEKCVELGATQFKPFHSAHRSKKTPKADQLQRVARAAMKQSQRLWLPKVEEVIEFTDLISSFKGNGIIAALSEQTLHIQSHLLNSENIDFIFIGPVGGFRDEEVKAAQAKGIQAVHLGSTRLRTETAAIFACGLILAARESK